MNIDPQDTKDILINLGVGLVFFVLGLIIETKTKIINNSKTINKYFKWLVKVNNKFKNEGVQELRDSENANQMLMNVSGNVGGGINVALGNLGDAPKTPEVQVSQEQGYICGRIKDIYKKFFSDIQYDDPIDISMGVQEYINSERYQIVAIEYYRIVAPFLKLIEDNNRPSMNQETLDLLRDLVARLGILKDKESTLFLPEEKEIYRDYEKTMLSFFSKIN